MAFFQNVDREHGDGEAADFDNLHGECGSGSALETSVPFREIGMCPAKDPYVISES